MPGPSITWDVIDDCSDLSSWAYTHAAQPNISENEDPAYIINGDKSFYFQADANGSSPVAYIEKAIVHTFKQDDRIGIIMHSPNRPEGTTSGFQAFGGTSSPYGGNKWRADFGSGSTIGSEIQGWQLHPLEFGNTTVDGASSPTIALDYASMRLRIQAHTTLPRDFYIDSVVRWRSRPTVIFQFDDGDETSYTEGFAYTNAAGIPLTHMLSHTLIGGSGYVTVQQALEMVAAGDEIGVHGSGTNAWQVSPSQIVTDAAAIRDLLGVEARHGAYPNGAYGRLEGTYQAVQAKCAEANLLSCRTVEKALLCPGAFSPYTLPVGVNLSSSVSLAQAKTAIDRAVKLGLTIIVTGHILEVSAGADTWAIADWQALIDYVVTLRDKGLVDTKNISEWWRGDTRPAA